MQVINHIQNEVLNNIGNIKGTKDFYLTGGTALSEFYLKHRRSYDLDFFTVMQESIVPYSYNVETFLKDKGFSVKRQRALDSFVELIVEKNNDNTIIHLAQDSAFRFESPNEFPKYLGLKVDSLVDIASNKFLALFGRAMLRDFIDVYMVVKKDYFKQDDLIEKAKTKDPGFDLYWLGVAFERINNFAKDSIDMLLLIENIDFDELLSFFNDWREEIVNKLKT